MDVYTPPKRIQGNIALVLAEYDPEDFYNFLKTLTYHDIEAVEKRRGEITRKYFQEMFDYLPLDTNSDDGIPFIEVINRAYYYPRTKKNARVIDGAVLSGLKEFYPRRYDERAFEIAGECLAVCYPKETPHADEVFEILDDTLKITMRRSLRGYQSIDQTVAAVHRRLQILRQAQRFDCQNPHLEARAAYYRGKDQFEMEDEVILDNQIREVLGREVI